jgi:hypothetical protein
MMLVCFILIAGSVYCQLKEFEIRQSETPDAIAVIQRDFPNAICLCIYSSIPNLSYESNMDGIEGDRNLPEEGKYLIYLKPMRQIITIKALGYRESYIQIPAGLKAKDSIYYLIEPKAASLKTEKGTFILNSVPAGADISIDGIPTFQAKTPYTFENFAAMTYKVSISKTRYATAEITITIDKDKPLSKTVELNPMWAELKIGSEPAGSIVYLNQKQVGITPCEISGLQNGLDPGKYSLELKPASEFYEQIKQTLNLKAGDKVDLKPLHKDNSGYLQINISPQPVEATINGKLDTALSRGEKVRLKAGNYDLRVSKSGADGQFYLPYIESFELTALEHKVISNVLSDLSGSLQLTFSHNPAQILLNNAENPALARGESLRLSSKQYRIKAIYQGEHYSAFPPFTADFALSAGESKTLPIVFQPKQGTIEIISKVDDISYSLLDKETGKTITWNKINKSPTIYSGAYTLTAIKQGYRKYTQEISFEAGSYPVEINLINISAMYKNKLSYWSVNQYAGSSITLATLAATTLFYLQAQSNYELYKKTNSSADAANYKHKSQAAATMFYGSLALDFVSMGWTVHALLKKHKWKAAMQNEMNK